MLFGGLPDQTLSQLEYHNNENTAWYRVSCLLRSHSLEKRCYCRYRLTDVRTACQWRATGAIGLLLY
jgi:hypothetical protein